MQRAKLPILIAICGYILACICSPSLALAAESDIVEMDCVNYSYWQTPDCDPRQLATQPWTYSVFDYQTDDRAYVLVEIIVSYGDIGHGHENGARVTITAADFRDNVFSDGRAVLTKTETGETVQIRLKPDIVIDGLIIKWRAVRAPFYFLHFPVAF